MIFFRQQRLLRLERKMKKEKRVGEAHLQENAPNHLERKRAKKMQTCHHLQRRTPSLRGEEMWRIHSKALVILTVFQIFVASIRNSQVLRCFLFARTCCLQMQWISSAKLTELILTNLFIFQELVWQETALSSAALVHYKKIIAN